MHSRNRRANWACMCCAMMGGSPRKVTPPASHLSSQPRHPATGTFISQHPVRNSVAPRCRRVPRIDSAGMTSEPHQSVRHRIRGIFTSIYSLRAIACSLVFTSTVWAMLFACRSRHLVLTSKATFCARAVDTGSRGRPWGIPFLRVQRTAVA